MGIKTTAKYSSSTAKFSSTTAKFSSSTLGPRSDHAPKHDQLDQTETKSINILKKDIRYYKY